MKKLTLAAAAATIALSFGALAVPNNTAPRKALANATRARHVMPPITHLSDWSGKTFFHARSRSVVVFLTKAPAGHTGYHSYGVDVSQQQVVFNIALVNGEELVRFYTDVAAQLIRASVANENPAEGYKSQIFGALGGPPPPPPPGPDHELAARLIRTADLSTKTNTQGLKEAGISALVRE
jgi:hypothetical protein